VAGSFKHGNELSGSAKGGGLYLPAELGSHEGLCYVELRYSFADLFQFRTARL
jgi:hypothetical protein